MTSSSVINPSTLAQNKAKVRANVETVFLHCLLTNQPEKIYVSVLKLKNANTYGEVAHMEKNCIGHEANIKVC